MSSTDTRTVDPAQPHHSENGGHELSDFSWTTVLWLIPISVIIMLVFFAVCIYWFKGAKDHEIAHKQAEFIPAELKAYHAEEDEILTSYKVLDKDKGRIRIPIARAMELVAQEHQGKPGKEWVPITDTYLEGAAFAAAAAAPAAEDNGIQVGDVPEARRGAKPAPSAKAPTGKAAQPAQNSAESKGATHNAPGGASKGKPEAASQGKK
jgi:hypothetical protein